MNDNVYICYIIYLIKSFETLYTEIIISLVAKSSYTSNKYTKSDYYTEKHQNNEVTV